MIVTIELRNGPKNLEHVTKSDLQLNIDAIDRAINNQSLIADINLLIDTKSILEVIKKELPDK